MSPVATEENPLRLTRCLRCGYSLETLPPEGTCPECGIAYDQQTVVMNAARSGSDGFAMGSTGAVVAYLGIWALIAGMMYWGGDHGLSLAVALFASPWVCAEFAYRVYARRAGVGSALLQCRFNRFGCLQCDLPEEIIGLGDIRPICRRVTQLVLFVVAVAFAWTSARHGQWIWVVLVAGLLFTPIAEWRRRRAIRRAQRDADGRVLMAAARSSGSQGPATPWSAIAEIRVGQFRRTSDRWYLASIAGQRGFKRVQAINAEVQATPAQIRELKARIKAWQRPPFER